MRIATIVLGVALLAQIPANAQYHYNYGDARVVNQNQTGLYQPSGTYIGAGTMSRSAQGKSAGVGNLAGPTGLPAVNMGGTIRTPGDNLYDNSQADRQSNGAIIYKDEEMRQMAIAREKMMRQQMRMMQQQRQVQQGTLYVPGSNGAAASYADAPQQQVIYTNGGAATYGQSYNNKPAAVRHF